jgi:NodT family efflux transporter outer membrane factor (OMF) lipoprotein
VTLRQTLCRAAALLPFTLLAGCAALGPDFVSPTAWWSPKSFTTDADAKLAKSVPVAAPVDPQWWKLLGDPMLTSLESRLATANLDLRLASLRLAESRAELGVSKAGLVPAVNGGAAFSANQGSRNGTLSLTPRSALDDPYNLYQYGFDASWELDFWGHVRRAVEQSAANVTATQEAGRDVAVTASAELARDYVRLRGIQRKLQITRQNLGSAQESLRLTQARAAGGLTTDLDVANAAAEVSTIRAQIPALDQQISELSNAIALLLGQPPRALSHELAAARPVPPVPPRVPVGVPSELARRRPDIRRAEAMLHAATAATGVAVADFYPRITLMGNGMLQGLQPANLADWASLAYSIGPSITLPIFDGGRRTRTLELRKAQQQEAAITYQRTVLGALHEVDNALTAYGAEQQRRDELARAVAQDRRAVALARDRYEQGVADFLQVLTAQRALLAAEQDLADSTTTVSTNLVALYKALGGGWENIEPPATGNVKKS